MLATYLLNDKDVAEKMEQSIGRNDAKQKRSRLEHTPTCSKAEPRRLERRRGVEIQNNKKEMRSKGRMEINKGD